MRIVGFVGVRRHRIGQYRVDRTGQEGGADHGRFVRTAEAAHVVAREPAWRKRCARDHGGDGVEHMVLGLLDDALGQRRGGGRDRIIGDAPGEARRI